jgi:hypothetical protein
MYYENYYELKADKTEMIERIINREQLFQALILHCFYPLEQRIIINNSVE